MELRESGLLGVTDGLIYFVPGHCNYHTPGSLLLPQPFFDYLKDHVFARFDLESGNVDLSRHTTGHGVARPESYTKARALQAILIVDKFGFILRPN